MTRVFVAREAMRTRFEIVLMDEARTEADLRAAGEEALDEITRYESLLSAYRSGAELRRVNAQAAQGPVRIDARLMAFLVQAHDLSIATDGAFDPTVGPLLRLWGIGGDAAAPTTAPGESEIAAARSLVGMRDLVVLDAEAGTIRFDRPGVRLDPGALGKGYALDQACAILREAGIRNALLHGGTSSVCAMGSDGVGDGWEIAVRHPWRVGAGSLVRTIRLRDRSLSVSTTKAGHTVDPRTGYPIEGACLAAAVAPDGATAEALSTALLVSGASMVDGLSARFPSAEVFIVRPED